MTSVGIIDYGMGNIRSVRNALELFGARVEVLTDPNGIGGGIDRLVLPGVGAFGPAISNLRAAGWHEAIRDHVDRARPFIGLCLGLQLLADKGIEDGEFPGLGLIPGISTPLEVGPRLRLPHIGWNEVRPIDGTGILSGVAPGTCFYFVHSCALVPDDASTVAGVTEYGGDEFVSVIERDNVVATQFHPEKSQRPGLELLGRFLAM